ncbi:MAG: hypothetical protein WHS43_03910 [Aquificaceae bacterium]|uniref:hypothetical protein n=1 Tax=Hydrogenobacter sp. Uz 6-8 TaxID=3384828 RepID=UPI000F28605D|nr:MAG: hypothetical protein D6804_00370 [Aquificota bacterium]
MSIRGSLRLSNNVCEDTFYDRPYIVIGAGSTLRFIRRPEEDINTFLMDYGRNFRMQDKRLLPLVYYLSKIRIIPPVFEWRLKENCEKVIVLSLTKTRLEGNALYISEKILQALQRGYSLMLEIWENYDGQNPELGPAILGEYYISETFLQNLQEALSILKSQVRTKGYIALTTEQSTYTACRLSSNCEHKPSYTDSINQLNEAYYSRLQEDLLMAVELIRNSKLDADYGVCFGG